MDARITMAGKARGGIAPISAATTYAIATNRFDFRKAKGLPGTATAGTFSAVACADGLAVLATGAHSFLKGDVVDITTTATPTYDGRYIIQAVVANTSITISHSAAATKAGTILQVLPCLNPGVRMVDLQFRPAVYGAGTMGLMQFIVNAGTDNATEIAAIFSGNTGELVQTFAPALAPLLRIDLMDVKTKMKTTLHPDTKALTILNPPSVIETIDFLPIADATAGGVAAALATQVLVLAAE